MRRSVVVPVAPVGKQRARFDGSGHVYTPEQTRVFENAVGLWWGKEHYAAWHSGVALRLTVEAVVERPSTNKARKAHPAYPTMTPDGSNILKAVEDGLNKIAYADDCQIVDTRCVKRYCLPGEAPHLTITIDDELEAG